MFVLFFMIMTVVVAVVVVDLIPFLKYFITMEPKVYGVNPNDKIIILKS